MVRFDTTSEDAAAIRKLARRARALETAHGGKPRTQMSWEMDFTATHLNGNPLDLTRLADADDFNFAHDAFGICRHLNRETGKIDNFFRPRFSAREAVSA